MRRCVEAHSVAAFGDIPVGSLWADDSPFIEDESKFVDADKAPTKKRPAKGKES